MTQGGKAGGPTRLGGSGSDAGGSGSHPSSGSSAELAADASGSMSMDSSMVGEVLDGRYRIFKKLGEGFDTLKQAVENQTKQTALMGSMQNRIEEMGDNLSEDHAAIADDAKGAHHHARRADDGIQELLVRIPHRINEKEVG